jgi:hypothetical protein
VHPNNEMHGMLFPQNGRLWYQETIFDTAHNRKVVDDTTQDCGEYSPTPQPPPVYTAQGPGPAPTYAVPPTTSDEVPIIVDRNEALAMVIIGGRSLSRFCLVNQRIGFLRFAPWGDLQGVWHGGKVLCQGER